jgi:homospermidine synthase
MATSEALAAPESAELPGRLIMIGCGSIGQAVLPLLRKHVSLPTDGLTVLSADERGRSLAGVEGARFVHCHLKPGNYHRQLAKFVGAGDMVLNLSVDVSSLDLVEW